MGCSSSKAASAGPLWLEPIPHRSAFDVVRTPERFSLVEEQHSDLLSSRTADGDPAAAIVFRVQQQPNKTLDPYDKEAYSVTDDKRPSQRGIMEVKGQDWKHAVMAAFVEHNGKKKPIFFSVRRELHTNGTGLFDILSTRQLYKSQKEVQPPIAEPDTHPWYSKMPLYRYATLQRNTRGSSSVPTLRIVGNREPYYSIHRAGETTLPSPNKNWLIKRKHVPVALIESSSSSSAEVGDDTFSAYKCTVCPGIDPMLVLSICVLCDELDEGKIRMKLALLLANSG